MPALISTKREQKGGKRLNTFIVDFMRLMLQHSNDSALGLYMINNLKCAPGAKPSVLMLNFALSTDELYIAYVCVYLQASVLLK